MRNYPGRQSAGRLVLLGGLICIAGCTGNSGSDSDDGAGPGDPDTTADATAAEGAVSPDSTEQTAHLIGAGYQLRFDVVNMRATGPQDSILTMTGTVTTASDERGCIRMELDADARLTQVGQPIADDFTVEARPRGADEDAEWTTYSAEVLNEDGIRCVLGRRPRPAP